MALANYTDLKASLSVWLDGSDLGSREGDLIALAEAEINARLADAIDKGAAIRPLVSLSTITIDNEYVALPDVGFTTILPISLEITGLSQPWMVSYVSPENIVDLKFSQDAARLEVYTEILSNPPRHYTVIGDNLRFFPAPQATFAGDFTRYAKLTPLSDGSPTNWVLSKHPNVYLYAALAEAEQLGWNDERVAVFAARFDNAMGGLVASYPSRADNRPLRSDLPLGSATRAWIA